MPIKKGCPDCLHWSRTRGLSCPRHYSLHADRGRAVDVPAAAVLDLLEAMAAHEDTSSSDASHDSSSGDFDGGDSGVAVARVTSRPCQKSQSHLSRHLALLAYSKSAFVRIISEVTVCSAKLTWRPS